LLVLILRFFALLGAGFLQTLAFLEVLHAAFGNSRFYLVMMFSFFFCWRLLLMFGGIWQGWFQVGLRLR
jgi:hypothetical protein